MGGVVAGWRLWLCTTHEGGLEIFVCRTDNSISAGAGETIKQRVCVMVSEQSAVWVFLLTALAAF